MLGHEDMIDNLLYGVALENNAFFLTIDEEFKNFIREKNNLEEIVIFPEELDRKNEKINPQHS